MLIARLCLAASVLLGYAVSLTVGDWDWDIDHMIYFGQRLLAGELHWTVEFDDKLPVNQFLFILPAAFDSLRVWQGMSLLAMAGGALAVAWIVRDILRAVLSERIAAFLQTRPEGARDFLVPYKMYAHWRLDEPRHGFVHAANTLFIAPYGWWRDLEVPPGFDLPRTLTEYCAMLDRKGPSLVVLTRPGGIQNCLDGSAAYAPAVPPGPPLPDVRFFLRRGSD